MCSFTKPTVICRISLFLTILLTCYLVFELHFLNDSFHLMKFGLHQKLKFQLNRAPCKTLNPKFFSIKTKNIQLFFDLIQWWVSLSFPHLLNCVYYTKYKSLFKMSGYLKKSSDSLTFTFFYHIFFFFFEKYFWLRPNCKAR